MQLPRMFLGDLAKGGGESPPDGPPWGVEPGDEQDSKDNGIRLLRALKPFLPPSPPPPSGPPWGVEPGDEEAPKKARKITRSKNP